MSIKISNPQKGFTLVEVAIVLMVIGLLIAGVLRGQELYRNAQISSTLQQAKSYQGAYYSFVDLYAQMPGDMVNALTRLPNCTSGNFCANGDGNRVLGITAYNSVQMDQSGAAMPRIETTLFWKHLSMAGLIAGVKPVANPAIPEAGETHPVAKMGGVFVVAHKTAGEPNSFATGPLLKMQRSPSSTGYILSPREAFMMDYKVDDGKPNSGFVAAENVGSRCKTNDSISGLYDLTQDDTLRCVLYFAL